MKYTVSMTLGYRWDNIEADSPEKAREMIEDDVWDRHLAVVLYNVKEWEGCSTVSAKLLTNWSSMFMVSWTINRGDNDLQDYFILVDSIEDARRETDKLREIEGIHCWAVSMVIDASEPDWMEGFWDDLGNRDGT